MQINIFNFDKDWNLVEPHLNDPEVTELLDQGMLRFSLRDDKWIHLPLWDVENGHGPWEYTKFDTHATYAFDKQFEDPEYNAMIDKYYGILSDMGIELEKDEFIEEFFDFDYAENSEDEKILKVAKEYKKELEAIYNKFIPKKNTYKWYQCFDAADYLCDWSKKLAEKTFPSYQWKIFRKYENKKLSHNNIEIMSGCTSTIGKNENDFLIFDIMLFNNTSIDEILEAVGLDRDLLTKEFG